MNPGSVKAPCDQQSRRAVPTGWTTESNTALPSRTASPSARFVRTPACTGSEAVTAAEHMEAPIRCYELARDSGVLRFWDSEEQDIYSLSDGEPV